MCVISAEVMDAAHDLKLILQPARGKVPRFQLQKVHVTSGFVLQLVKCISGWQVIVISEHHVLLDTV